MYTFSITIVVTLVFSQNIHSLDLVEVDINNIFKNVDKQKQRIQAADYKKSNVDELTKFFNRVIKGLSVDDDRSKVYKEKKLNLGQNQYSSEDFNKVPIKKVLKVKPHLFKLHPKQTVNDQSNEEQAFYKDIRNDRNDYSKVYLVLDPDSNLSNSDVKDINKLVSSLFSRTAFNKKATFKDHKGIRRYKGFVIRDVRRRIKDKQEKYAKSSKENDYKVKRGRGGGSGGGRTAIPYIRHRGDIYEKD
ncbi:uncharacterized protein LOC126770943 [Nymphalis io]|uniref:uncharacterized protein LOC126770943 n=1 Tax=Inachis io TaxID=171585 RepID=UPI0021691D6C|nr:uncharacterized protein LOC126770943 [Nymphalis io]